MESMEARPGAVRGVYSHLRTSQARLSVDEGGLRHLVACAFSAEGNRKSMWACVFQRVTVPTMIARAQECPGKRLPRQISFATGECPTAAVRTAWEARASRP